MPFSEIYYYALEYQNQSKIQNTYVQICFIFLQVFYSQMRAMVMHSAWHGHLVKKYMNSIYILNLTPITWMSLFRCTVQCLAFYIHISRHVRCCERKSAFKMPLTSVPITTYWTNRMAICDTCAFLWEKIVCSLSSAELKLAVQI